jgi:hypothetical protein
MRPEPTKDVFKILGINPTNDFLMVKRFFLRKALELLSDNNAAINAAASLSVPAKELTKFFASVKEVLGLHSDNNAAESDQRENQLEKLTDAYDLVRDEEKLVQYYESSKRDNNNTATATSDDNNASVDGTSTAVRTPTEIMTDVYILLEVEVAASPSSTSQLGCFIMDSNVKRFGFEDIARFISNRSKQSICLVGLTREEALNLANEHKFGAEVVIVNASVSISNLSDRQTSEVVQLKKSGRINLSNNPYFYLHKNTALDTADILSISIMGRAEYKNSIGFLSFGGAYRLEALTGSSFHINPLLQLQDAGQLDATSSALEEFPTSRGDGSRSGDLFDRPSTADLRDRQQPTREESESVSQIQAGLI